MQYSAFDFQMHARMCPSLLKEIVSQTSHYNVSKIKKTKNLLQIPHTNLKRFGDRAICAYAPCIWNELPINIKAAESEQNFQTAENIAISKGV